MSRFAPIPENTYICTTCGLETKLEVCPDCGLKAMPFEEYMQYEAMYTRDDALREEQIERELEEHDNE